MMIEFPNPNILYKKMNLLEYWEDSTVKDVYLSSDVIEDIRDLYIDDNISVLDLSKEQGAFLLGSFKELKDLSYNVSIDKLVAIDSDSHSSTQIEFGYKAWATLDTALDENPDLVIVGWFHTHPGHGIFLSNLDINISETFFNKSFQLAMLVDPVEGQRDNQLSLGIFSFRKEGRINNY